MILTKERIMCKCGHERKYHGNSYDEKDIINTIKENEGMCTIKIGYKEWCPCMKFMPPVEKNTLARIGFFSFPSKGQEA